MRSINPNLSKTRNFQLVDKFKFIIQKRKNLYSNNMKWRINMTKEEVLQLLNDSLTKLKEYNSKADEMYADYFNR